MGVTLLAFTADWHVNDIAGGLCPPIFKRELDSEHRPGPATLSIYSAWKEYWGIIADKKAELERLERRLLRKAAVDVYSVCVGDLGDENEKEDVQLISKNEKDVHRAMLDVAAPMLDVVPGDHTFVIRGTRTHTGPNGALEEWFAEKIGAIPCSYEDAHSWWVLKATWEGVRFHIAHHGPTGTMLPHKKGSAAARAAEYTAAAYNRQGLTPPDFAVFGHRHFPAAGHELRVRARLLPCWKLVGGFGYRIGATLAEPVGGWWCVLRDGKLVEEPEDDGLGPFQLWEPPRIGEWVQGS